MARPRVVDGLDELLAGARRLRDRDPDRFMRVLSLLRAYVAIYERPEEPREISIARLQRAIGVKGDA